MIFGEDLIFLWTVNSDRKEKGDGEREKYRPQTEIGILSERETKRERILTDHKEKDS